MAKTLRACTNEECFFIAIIDVGGGRVRAEKRHPGRPESAADLVCGDCQAALCKAGGIDVDAFAAEVEKQTRKRTGDLS